MSTTPPAKAGAGVAPDDGEDLFALLSQATRAQGQVDEEGDSDAYNVGRVFSVLLH